MDIVNLILNSMEIVAIIILGFLFKSYLPTYFAEKGKNLATKEDIREITDKIESVRTEYAKQEHVHGIAFNKEFETLSEIWKTLVELRYATQGLRPIYDYLDLNESAEDRRQQRLKRFSAAYKVFADTVLKNQPFYPKEIYESLWSIMMISRDEADEYNEYALDEIKGKEYWGNSLKNQKKIIVAVDNICEQIRQRILA